jgi:hypothetical protein
VEEAELERDLRCEMRDVGCGIRKNWAVNKKALILK